MINCYWTSRKRTITVDLGIFLSAVHTFPEAKVANFWLLLSWTQGDDT